MHNFSVTPRDPSTQKLPGEAEMRHFDAQTITSGTAAAVLMERAGSAVAEWLRENVLKAQPARTICILCGPGNNGGDGFVAARILHSLNYRVKVICSSAASNSVEAQTAREQAQQAGLPIHICAESQDSLHAATEILASSSVLVDALLGVGQRQAPRGVLAQLVDICRELEPSSSERIAIDIPTGMHADTGEIFEPHFKAHQTLCVELVKRGLLQFPSRAVCGEVHALPIGIDTKGNCDFELLTPQSFPPIPRRSFDAHKGSFGKVLVIGGSHSMPGAAILAAHASLRSGAGIVRLLSPGVVHPNLWPEIMIVPCADKTVLTLKSLAQTKRALQQSSVVVLGPGLGNEKQTIQYSGAVLKECAKLSIPVVLDADALPALSLLKDSELPELICTPHPGELARLLGHTTEEIQRDRYKACFAAQMACAKAVWVLKGAGTIVFSKSHGYVSPYASPFLATAGSGDVLAGIIAALRAQHIPSTQAAGLGVLLHFETARELLLKGVCPLRAHDLIETIPKVWEQVLYE